MAYKLEKADYQPPYRYSLTVRTDSESHNRLVVIQCNPSTATTLISDPTVGKVAIWAEENKFNTVCFLNLFALISPKPSALSEKPYELIVGPDNDSVIRKNINQPNATLILASGGNIPIHDDMYQRRLEEIRELIMAEGCKVYQVGELSHGRYPRHGRSWNKGNRNLEALDWNKILKRSH